MPLDLAVIGGGPKGAAIAAKATALRAAGYDAPAITIYEPHSLGASWSGQFGYTDGLQLLCTLAERDLGYPYDARTFGDAAAEYLFAEYSWHRFSASAGEYGKLGIGWQATASAPGLCSIHRICHTKERSPSRASLGGAAIV